MKLGFDLDGCLAQFNVAFHALLCARHGNRFPEDYNPGDPPVWEWPRFFGYAQEEEAEVWREVWEGCTFWGDLNVIPGEQKTIWHLNDLNRLHGHEIHFITNRKGKCVQFQSAWFLRNAGFQHPSVIIARDKTPIIEALGLDAFIDDRIETANELAVARRVGDILTRVYLRHTRHNQENRDPDLIVVNSVWEMLEKEGLLLPANV